MLFDPAKWLEKFMQLTKMSLDFELFILGLGVTFLIVASLGEKIIFPWMSRQLGNIMKKTSKTPKEKKTYKKVQEQLRF